MSILFACGEVAEEQVQESPSLRAFIDERDIYGDSSFPVNLDSNQKESLEDSDFEYTIIPSGLVKIATKSLTNKPHFQCVRSGDFAISFTSLGASASVEGTCTMISSIQLPRRHEIIIGLDIPAFSIQAFNEKQEPITVPPEKYQIVIDDPSVVSNDLNDQGIQLINKLLPKSVGETNITYSIGSISAKSTISVGKKIDSSPLSISDGAGKLYTLQTGFYSVEVNAKDKSGNGTTIEWIGADCPKRSESTFHKVKCSVYNTATLKVENPTVMGLGNSVNGYINLYEIPKF